MQKESVDKLKLLLEMLDSQIVLDHRGTDSNTNMKEDTNLANLSRIIEKPGSRKKRHRSLTGSRTNLSSRQRLKFDSESERNNNDGEDQYQEDIANQSSQMLAILREEKRRSIIPPPLSPALSSSTFKSPARLRTPGPASKTIHEKAGSTFGTKTLSQKPLPEVSNTNRRQTVSGIPTLRREKSSHSQERTVVGYHKDNDWMPNFQELDPDMGTARSSRSDSKKKGARVVVTTGVIIKEEKPDDGYEASAPTYDEINDVEVVASVHICPTCNKEFDSQSKMKAHVSKAHSDKNRIKHYNCPHCAWTSIFPGSLRAHIAQSHGNKNKSSNLVCGFCSKNFTNSATWEEHTKICVKRKDNDDDEQLRSPAVSRRIKKSRASPSTHTCLDCYDSFASRSLLVRHKNQNCHGKTINGPPFTCKHCNAIFTKKRGLAQHVMRNCPHLKEKASGSLKKSDGLSDSEEHLSRQNSNIEGEEDEHFVTDQGDPEDTRDDHVSCKECGGKPFTKEGFIKHQQQTGHTGETIRLPSNLSI